MMDSGSSSVSASITGEEESERIVTAVMECHYEVTNAESARVSPNESQATDDEEDLHQCFRCKSIFHTLQEYISHKLGKCCRKVKPPADRCQVVSGALVTQADEGKTEIVYDVKSVHSGGAASRPAEEARGRVLGPCDRPSGTAPDQDTPGCVGNDCGVDESIGTYDETNELFPAASHGDHDDQTSEVKQTTNTSSTRKAKVTKKRKRGRPKLARVAAEEDDVRSDSHHGDVDEATEADVSITPSSSRRLRKRTRLLQDEDLSLSRSIHTGDNLKQHHLSCPQCDSTFLKQADFDSHLRRKHALSNHWCKLCRASFADQYKLKRHEDSGKCPRHLTPTPDDPATDAPVMVSTRLRKRLQDISPKLTDEMIEVDDEDELDVSELFERAGHFNCQMCGEVFGRYGELHSHLASRHADTAPAVCCFCAQWFSTKYHITRHVNSSIHDDVEASAMAKFKLAIKTTKSYNWKPENVTSEASPDYECGTCGQICRSKLALTRHKRKQHGVDETMLACIGCKSTFSTRSQLKAHMKADCIISPSTQCSVCDRQFKHFTHMTRHADTLHTVVPPGPQETVAFSDVSRLKHLLQSLHHGDTSSIQCFVCCKPITDDAHFLRHIQDHRVWAPNQDGGPYPPGIFDTFPLPPPFVNKSERSKRWYTQLQTAAAADDHEPSTNSTEEGVKTSDKTSDHDLLRNLLLEINQVTEAAVTVGSPVHREVGDVGQVHSNPGPISRPVTAHESELHATNSEGEKDPAMRCPYCMKPCADLSDLYQHKTEFHQLVLVFRCCVTSCRETFCGVDDYWQHSQLHRQTAFICSICNDHVGDMGELITHKQVQHRGLYSMGGVENTCSICNRSFSSKKELEAHTKNDKAHHPCVTCGKVFRKPSELRLHEASHTGVKSFLCDLCGSTFANGMTLQRHRHTHSTTRSIQCQHCDACFHQREHLRRHILTKHSDEKPFACTYPDCSKSFKRKDKLQEHFKTHSLEKKYSCGVCGRRYRHKEGLRYHEKTHERDTGFKCPQCDVLIPRMGQLRQHMNEVHRLTIKETHLYRCVTCRAPFSRPERVKRHMEKEHGIRAEWAHTCDICQEGFAGPKSLSKHMEKHQDGKDNPRKKKKRKAVTNFTSNFTPTAVQPMDGVVGISGTELTSEDLQQQNHMEENITHYVQVKGDDGVLTSVSAFIGNPDPELAEPPIQPHGGHIHTIQEAYSVETSKSMACYIPHESVYHFSSDTGDKRLEMNNVKTHKFHYADVSELSSGHTDLTLTQSSTTCAVITQAYPNPTDPTESPTLPDNTDVMVGTDVQSKPRDNLNQSQPAPDTMKEAVCGDVPTDMNIAVVSDNSCSLIQIPPSSGELSFHPIYVQDGMSLARQSTQTIVGDKFILVPHLDRPAEYHAMDQPVINMLPPEAHLIQSNNAPLQLLPSSADRSAHIQMLPSSDDRSGPIQLLPSPADRSSTIQLLTSSNDRTGTVQLLSTTNDRCGTVQYLPSSNDRTGTVQLLPSSNDRTGTVQLLPSSNDRTGTVQLLPSTNDRSDTVQLLPSTNDRSGTVQLLPSTNDRRGTVQMLPSSNSGTVQLLPSSNDRSATVQLLPSSNDRSGTLQLLPSSNDRSGPLHFLSSSNDRSGAVQLLSTVNDRSGPVQLLPSSNDRSGPLQLLPSPNDRSGPVQLLPSSNDRTGSLQLLPLSSERTSRDPVLGSVAHHSTMILGDVVPQSSGELQQLIIPLVTSGGISLSQASTQLPSLTSIQSIGTFMNY